MIKPNLKKKLILIQKLCKAYMFESQESLNMTSRNRMIAIVVQFQVVIFDMAVL